jgi:hypothetical protein
MPVSELLIDAFVSSNNWASIGPAVSMRVDNTPPSSIRGLSGSSNELRYSFDNLPAPAARVDSVSAYWRRGWDVGPDASNAGNFNLYRNSIGTGSPVAVESTQDIGYGSTFTSGALATAPGGVAWTVPIVNDTEVQFTADLDPFGSFGVCFAKVIVLWQMDDEDSHFSVVGLAGAAIGLHEMGRLAAAIFARTGVRFLDRELAPLWRALRSQRRPVFAGP